ncbi:methionine/alanine import family NSS transporter small subunit [Sediminivirga luteola]|jgi:hypothetical protein|nr:methionine/alanine import family NSS transporter small subunit [Sediminivirga luteola]MCI2264230.1 methionine/alanine import family NSS transporter small subunit [Sediminivirga luteola]
MTPLAIVTMILSIVIFWGGLAYSVLRLRRHPESQDDS